MQVLFKRKRLITVLSGLHQSRFVERFFLFALIVVSGQAFAEMPADVKKLIDAKQFDQAALHLGKKLEQNQQDVETQFWYARTLSWAGHFSESTEQYQQLLKIEPNNADYWLGLAQSYIWAGNAKDALPATEHARRLNPQDPDIWRLNIRALSETGGRSQAERLQNDAAKRFPNQDWNELGTQVVAINPKDSLVLDRRLSGYQQARPLQMELSATYDNLDNRLKDWQAYQLDVEYKFAPRTLIYGNLRHVDRFDTKAFDITAGFYYPLSKKLTMNMEFSDGPEKRLIATNSQSASLQYAFANGWVGTAGFRRAEYSQLKNIQLPLTIEKYLNNFRIGYTVTPTRVEGATLYSHRLSGSYYYNETYYNETGAGASSVNLNLSEGEEADVVFTPASNRLVIASVTGLSLSGRHWLNPSRALTWELGHTRQGNLYNRDTLRLGIRQAF